MKTNLKAALPVCCPAITGGTTTPLSSTKNEGLPGLYIENGRFMRKGREYYGVGANFYDLFNRTIGVEDLSGLPLLEQIARYGVPFLRITIGAYTPRWWAEYIDTPEVHLQKLDLFVRKAEEVGIGLIPVFFWNIATIADINEEHMDALEDPDSKTSNFIAKYATDVVSRYKDSEALWGWEFGNEYNLEIDIPHKPTPPILDGTWVTERDPVRDVLTQKGMLTAFGKFVNAVRQYDNTRPVFSGNDIPRSSAYHNTHSDLTDWEQDTPEQHLEMLRIYEGPMDTVTSRGFYDMGTESQRHLYPCNIVEYRDYLKWLVNACSELGKPLYLGEFADTQNPFETVAGQKYPDTWTSRESWEKKFDAIVRNRVQLSAFFNFGTDTDAVPGVDNDPNGVLDMVLEANRKLNECCGG